MKRLVLLVMVGVVGLAGCAAQTARTNEGYAMYGDGERRKQTDDVRRSQDWSTHDFVYPRGLIW